MKTLQEEIFCDYSCLATPLENPLVAIFLKKLNWLHLYNPFESAAVSHLVNACIAKMAAQYTGVKSLDV